MCRSVNPSVKKSNASKTTFCKTEELKHRSRRRKRSRSRERRRRRTKKRRRRRKFSKGKIYLYPKHILSSGKEFLQLGLLVVLSVHQSVYRSIHENIFGALS